MSSDKPSREAVEALLAKNPYNPSNQAALEAYVQAEARGECPYYLDANRSLLKLYQFFPQSANPNVVALVFLLALLEFPTTDVLALSYLVPDRLNKSEPTATILQCATLLDSCKFSEFWTTYRGVSGEEPIRSLAGGASIEKLQRAIVEVLALSYRSSSLAKVLAALNMHSGDELANLKHPCVESVDGDRVVFVPTADNTKRNRVYQEGVNFGSIASMLAKVSTE